MADQGNITSALTVADLDRKADELRIEDRRLAGALGFTECLTIRKLIKRHEIALRNFGEVFATWTKPGSVGRPGKTYWLNRKQALYITAKSDTDRSAEVTIQMVEVFDAWQSGQLAEIAPPTLAPGLLFMMLGGRQILVDANDYQIGAGDEAVVCGREGKVSIMRGPLAPNVSSPWLGKRSVHGHWRKPGKNAMVGTTRERGTYTVLGRLIEPGERRRRMIAAA